MSDALAIQDLGQADFLNAGQQLLPYGDAWPVGMDAALTALLNASVAGLARVHEAAALLVEQEAVPWKSVALLPAWEAVYNLPDPCTPLNATIPQRQAAVQARVAAQGGQNDDYYVGIAAALGYSITITRFAPGLFGVSKFGDKFYPPLIRYTWQVNVAGQAAFPSKFGVNVFGDPFVAYSGSQLTCVLNRIKPAYSVLIMNYL